MLCYISATLPTQQSVLLQYKFRKGESHVYGMAIGMKMSMGAQTKFMDMDLQMKMRQTVEKVTPSGVATITGSILSETTKMNGKPTPRGNMSGQGFSFDMAPNGKPSHMHMSGINAMGSNGMDLQNMQFGTVLPTKPVHVGSHWTSSFNVGGMGAIEIQNTLERIYSEGGSTLALVGGSANMDMGKMMSGFTKASPGSTAAGMMHMKLTFTFNITKGTAQAFDADGNYTVNMHMAQAQQGQPSDMKMKGIQHIAMKLLQ